MDTGERVTGKCIGNKQAIIAKAFKTVAKSLDMQDRWVSCETWASAINQRTNIGTTMTVNGGTVSRSLSSDKQLQAAVEVFSGANSTGFFMVVFMKTKGARRVE